MEKQIKCPICGKDFLTSKPRKKYCSFSCKEAGAKLARMKWEARNPDYVKNYVSEYRKRTGQNGNNEN
jgi:hypothetical protein